MHVSDVVNEPGQKRHRRYRAVPLLRTAGVRAVDAFLQRVGMDQVELGSTAPVALYALPGQGFGKIRKQLLHARTEQQMRHGRHTGLVRQVIPVGFARFQGSVQVKLGLKQPFRKGKQWRKAYPSDGAVHRHGLQKAFGQVGRTCPVDIFQAFSRGPGNVVSAGLVAKQGEAIRRPGGVRFQSEAAADPIHRFANFGAREVGVQVGVADDQRVHEKTPSKNFAQEVSEKSPCSESQRLLTILPSSRSRASHILRQSATPSGLYSTLSRYFFSGSPSFSEGSRNGNPDWKPYLAEYSTCKKRLLRSCSRTYPNLSPSMLWIYSNGMLSKARSGESCVRKWSLFRTQPEARFFAGARFLSFRMA